MNPPLPPLCPYHEVLYAAKAAKLRRRGRVRHPGAGRRALVDEATHVSDQCCRRVLGLLPRWRP